MSAHHLNQIAGDRPCMSVRLEYWFAADDRNILRRNAAPALHVTEPTVEPVPLPSFGGKSLLLDIRALGGNVVVEIGTTNNAADYDPVGNGRLLLEGESQRFLVYAESYVVIHEWKRLADAHSALLTQP